MCYCTLMFDLFINTDDQHGTSQVYLPPVRSNASPTLDGGTTGNSPSMYESANLTSEPHVYEKVAKEMMSPTHAGESSYVNEGLHRDGSRKLDNTTEYLAMQ